MKSPGFAGGNLRPDGFGGCLTSINGRPSLPINSAMHRSGGLIVTRRQAICSLLSATAVAAAGTTAQAKTVQLQPPRASGGKPLIDALKLRRSIREYSNKPLEPQLLSDLMWSAFGINRPATGDRTAPYWRHVMVIDVYAAMADGVWFYDPKLHALVLHQEDDLRAQTGRQDFVAAAPTSFMWHTANGCRAFRSRSGISTRQPMPASSARMSICSARRKDWPPCFAPLSTSKRWRKQCILSLSSS